MEAGRERFTVWQWVVIVALIYPLALALWTWDHALAALKATAPSGETGEP